MTDREYSTGNYKCSKSSIGALIKNLEMLVLFLITSKLKICVIIRLKNYLS